MTISDGPRTKADWDAYRELPDWQVTVILTRTARFRVHASSPEDAREHVLSGRNGVASVDDLYDPGDLEFGEVISVEAVSGDPPGVSPGVMSLPPGMLSG